jgi:hypothetical protein
VVIGKPGASRAFCLSTLIICKPNAILRGECILQVRRQLGARPEDKTAVKTASKDVGLSLEKKCAMGDPIFYQQVVNEFPDLPPLTGNWKSHPLCSIFGDLDSEDHRKDRPFRTAIVCTKENGRPGPGFFEEASRLRSRTILKADQDEFWITEFNAVCAYYK